MMKKCDNRLPSCLTPEERKAPDVCAYPKTHKDAPAPAFVRHTHTHTQKYSESRVDPVSEGRNIHTASGGVSNETKTAEEERYETGLSGQ